MHSLLIDWKLTVVSFFLHGLLVLKYADSSNQRHFFLRGLFALEIRRVRLQMNTHDCKKALQQEQLFFFDALLFFSSRLFLVY